VNGERASGWRIATPVGDKARRAKRRDTESAERKVTAVLAGWAERSSKIVQKRGPQDGKELSRTGNKDDAGGQAALGCQGEEIDGERAQTSKNGIISHWRRTTDDTKGIREYLGVKSGDRVKLFVHLDGTVVLLPKRLSKELRRLLNSRPSSPD